MSDMKKFRRINTGRSLMTLLTQNHKGARNSVSEALILASTKGQLISECLVDFPKYHPKI